MIRIIVNGVELVLPEDLSITMVDENPVVTRNGKSSHDITVSLLEGKNARAFNNPQRINNNQFVKTANAVLFEDLKATKGTAIVLPKTTPETITFQFVAENSELNYLTQQTQKIWELDFGSESTIEYAKALFTIQHPGYGAVMSAGTQIGFNKFVCSPVKYNSTIANNYALQVGLYESPGQIDGVENIVMQPYLLYYVEKLIELLGFYLVDNVLIDYPLARHLFITTLVQSNKYSDALPDMSIGEFVSAIEEFFNVFFLISSDKRCFIIDVNTYVENMPIIPLTEVEDTFERNSVNQSSETTSLSYDLGKTGFHKYQKINPEIIKASIKLHYSGPSVMRNLIHADQLNKFIIHITDNDQHEHIYTPDAQENVYKVIPNGAPNSCIYVNKFKNYGSSENPLVLKIRPLAYTTDKKEYWIFQDGLPQLITYLPYQLPFESSDLYTPQSQVILTAVEDNLVQSPRKNTIEVGIFSGMIELFNVAVFYPVSYVDNVPEFFALDRNDQGNFTAWVIDKYKATCNLTLRLVGNDGIYDTYFRTKLYDESIEYVFKMPSNVDLNTSKLYFYKHQKYIPIRFEKQLSKRKNYATGYFYRMKP
ncbi:MAG: hypothetical protein PHU68_10660 [Paludibacter sp.]|nr:hypothetical protein [Paludibacter sp.]